jgi:hypothetical protein
LKKIILFIHTNKIVRRRLHSAGTNWLPFNDKSMSEIDSIFYNFFHMVHFAQLCTFEWYTLLTFPVIHIHIIYILQPSLRLNVIFQDRHFLVATVNDLPLWISVWTKNGENITKPHHLTLFPPNFRRIGKTMIL